MGVMSRWMPVTALFLGACGASETPLPSIESVEPSRLSTSECVALSVGLGGTLPLKLDYATRSASRGG
jgi:hypothetical protein